MVDDLFFSRCCSSSTTSLRYSSSSDQALCDLALLCGDGPVVLDAPYRERRRPPRRSAAARSGPDRPAASPKLTETPSAPAAIAVRIPIRKPPKAVAKNTAGKYGVKNTSGRIWAKTPARRGRQSEAADRKAHAEQRRGLGNSLPAVPEFVDQFRHGVVTSRDQRIQNKAEHGGNPGFPRPRSPAGRFCPGRSAPEQARLRLFPAAGILRDQDCISERETTWDGWTARSR